MPKAKNEAAKATEAAEEVSSPSKGFTVLDSNGKPVRTAKTEEEAQALAKVFEGRVVR